MEAWKPCDLILTSRQKVRGRAQRLLFERHKEYFPDTSVPLLYRPKDTRRQNIMVTIPGPLLDGRPDQQELVLNDVVEVPLKYAREVLGGKWGQDWALGYALTVHSSQSLTVADPQKVWIIDDFLQWSNLAYLAVSRVQYLSQLERVVCPPPEEGSEGARTLTEQQLRKVIQRKLVAYKRQDQAKGLRFSLKVDHILALKEAQNNRCAACNIELLWAYQPKDTQEFSVDRFDNSAGHIHDNVRLTCLECNRKRGSAALSLENPIRRKLSVGRHYEEFLPDKTTRRPILQVIQHRLIGPGHRASEPVNLKRPHRVYSASTAAYQLARLVQIANANSRGASAPRDQPGGQELQRSAFLRRGAASWP